MLPAFRAVPRPWLYAIATHQAVDALRRASRQAAVSLDQQVEAGEPIEPGALVDLLAGEVPSPLDELEEEERRLWVRSPERTSSSPVHRSPPRLHCPARVVEPSTLSKYFIDVTDKIEHQPTLIRQR